LGIWQPFKGESYLTIREFGAPAFERPTVTRDGLRLAWTPDGEGLWFAVDGRAFRWSATKADSAPLLPLTHATAVEWLAVAPEGDALLARDTSQRLTLRDLENGNHIRLGRQFGVSVHWLSDGRRFIASDVVASAVHAFDARCQRRLGVLFSAIGNEAGRKEWLCVGPSGHYRGSDNVTEHIVLVAMHDDGSQVTYTPTQFREKFGWKNDPAKAILLELSE
jgi:hypothetical protein